MYEVQTRPTAAAAVQATSKEPLGILSQLCAAHVIHQSYDTKYHTNYLHRERKEDSKPNDHPLVCTNSSTEKAFAERHHTQADVCGEHDVQHNAAPVTIVCCCLQVFVTATPHLVVVVVVVPTMRRSREKKVLRSSSNRSTLLLRASRCLYSVWTARE